MPAVVWGLAAIDHHWLNGMSLFFSSHLDSWRMWFCGQTFGSWRTAWGRRSAPWSCRQWAQCIPWWCRLLQQYSCTHYTRLLVRPFPPANFYIISIEVSVELMDRNFFAMLVLTSSFYGGLNQVIFLFLVLFLVAGVGVSWRICKLYLRREG